ncbi:hypothetical protein VNO77_29503 [Canavalia gladiata]|uniref:Uncharacterized protein n=1 Tax=Canavalia gladiata TaxID=3824 RepID=A0AAN9Q7S6_CANGL
MDFITFYPLGALVSSWNLCFPVLFFLVLDFGMPSARLLTFGWWCQVTLQRRKDLISSKFACLLIIVVCSTDCLWIEQSFVSCR